MNVAIDVEVGVRLFPRQAGWCLRLGERKREVASLDELLGDEETRLTALVALHHGLPPSEVELFSASPRSAGLGASSSLCVALSAACESRLGRDVPAAAELVHTARDLEARLMSLPTGIQDHYPAVLGGALEIRHEIGGERVRRLAVDLGALGERLVVVYSGRSHFSAGNNWEVISRRLSGDATVSGCLATIAEVAGCLAAELEAGNWPAAGALMSREMAARAGLSEVIVTPEVREILALAEAQGAWGGKVCGAGGGGCVALMAPPEAVGRLAERLSREGFDVVPGRPVATGLEVRQE